MAMMLETVQSRAGQPNDTDSVDSQVVNVDIEHASTSRHRAARGYARGLLPPCATTIRLTEGIMNILDSRVDSCACSWCSWVQCFGRIQRPGTYGRVPFPQYQDLVSTAAHDLALRLYLYTESVLLCIATFVLAMVYGQDNMSCIRDRCCQAAPLPVAIGVVQCRKVT
jgi:hypothetical protein